MYYFDNVTLAQYLDQGVKLKVFVDHEWYQIADPSDIQNPRKGIAYDDYANPKEFDYRDIQQVMAGSRTVDVETLQTQHGGQPDEKEKKPKADDSGGEEDLGSEEEPAPEEKEKEPDLSWYSPVFDVGRKILRENQKRRRSI